MVAVVALTVPLDHFVFFVFCFNNGLKVVTLVVEAVFKTKSSRMTVTEESFIGLFTLSLIPDDIETVTINNG